MNIDEYKAKIRTLSTPRLGDELRMVMLWKQAVPECVDGRERYAACFEFCEETPEGKLAWRVAKLQLNGQLV